MQREISLIAYFTLLAELKKALSNRCVSHVMPFKMEHSNMAGVPQPSRWFTLSSYVSDSLASKTLCRMRGGNFGVGNMLWNKFSKKYSVCPFCATQGVRVRLGESHVLFVCSAVRRLQVSFSLSEFRNQVVLAGILTTQGVLRHYDGGMELII